MDGGDCCTAAGPVLVPVLVPISGDLAASETHRKAATIAVPPCLSSLVRPSKPVRFDSRIALVNLGFALDLPIRLPTAESACCLLGALLAERPCFQGLFHGASRARTGDLLGAIPDRSPTSGSEQAVVAGKLVDAERIGVGRFPWTPSRTCQGLANDGSA